MELVEDCRTRWIFAELQHSLNYATAVGMHGSLLNPTGECVDDEVDVFRRNSLNGLLYDMIAVLIFDAFHNVILQFFHK